MTGLSTCSALKWDSPLLPNSYVETLTHSTPPPGDGIWELGPLIGDPEDNHLFPT